MAGAYLIGKKYGFFKSDKDDTEVPKADEPAANGKDNPTFENDAEKTNNTAV